MQISSIEPIWVEERVALTIHSRQITTHGGGDGVRDAGLLQSALMRPLNAFHYNQVTSLTDLAAAYAFGIAKNHPFVDGNKRTAFVITRLFLMMNGYDLQASKEEKYHTFYDLGAGKIEEEVLAAWLKSKLVEM